MDADNVQKMGLSNETVREMIAAWLANQQLWSGFFFLAASRRRPGRTRRAAGARAPRTCARTAARTRPRRTERSSMVTRELRIVCLSRCPRRTRTSRPFCSHAGRMLSSVTAGRDVLMRRTPSRGPPHWKSSTGSRRTSAPRQLLVVRCSFATSASIRCSSTAAPGRPPSRPSRRA